MFRLVVVFVLDGMEWIRGDAGTQKTPVLLRAQTERHAHTPTHCTAHGNGANATQPKAKALLHALKPQSFHCQLKYRVRTIDRVKK